MKKYLLTVLLFSAFFSSCSKRVDSSNASKENLIQALGFDPSTVQLLQYDPSKINSALKFNSKEDAIKFFKGYVQSMQTPYYGNAFSKKEEAPGDLIKDSTFTGFIKRALASAEAESDTAIQQAVMLNNYVNYVNGYSVSFVYTAGGNVSGGGPYSAFGFNSSLIGFVMGVTWNQQSASYYNYPNSSLIYFTINGTQNYNLIIDGIGTLFTQPGVLSGVYNINTGAYSFTMGSPKSNPE